jgi:hypothetical protein
MFIFGLYLSTIVQGYLFLSVNIANEMSYAFLGVQSLFSLSMAVLAAQFLLFFHVMTLVHYCWYRKRPEVFEKGKFLVLYDGVKLKRKITSLYTFWYMTR